MGHGRIPSCLDSGEDGRVLRSDGLSRSHPTAANPDAPSEVDAQALGQHDAELLRLAGRGIRVSGLGESRRVLGVHVISGDHRIRHPVGLQHLFDFSRLERKKQLPVLGDQPFSIMIFSTTDLQEPQATVIEKDGALLVAEWVHPVIGLGDLALLRQASVAVTLHDVLSCWTLLGRQRALK